MGPEREKGAFSPADRPGSCKGLFSCQQLQSPLQKNTLILLNYTALHAIHVYTHGSVSVHVFILSCA